MAEFITSIDIEAPPEIVFELISTPEGLVTWIGQHAVLDATPGGAFALDIDGTPVRGEVVEVDPPHAVVVTWGVAGNADLPPGCSRVEFRLTPTAAGTRLDLAHTELPDSQVSDHEGGWGHFLPRLAETVAATR